MKMATILLSYLINPLVIVSVSMIIPAFLYLTISKKVSAKKRLIATICAFAFCVLINCGICAMVAQNPIVICPSEYSEYIDDEGEEQLQEVVKSLYANNKGLLFPAVIEVNYANNKQINAHIQYLFFGTVEFSIDADQTKSIDKPLY